jgi:hypothetical protein
VKSSSGTSRKGLRWNPPLALKIAAFLTSATQNPT